MTTADYLVVLNILIAFLGVLFVLFTLFEWHSLRTLKKNFLSLEKRLEARQYAAMKAAHRVISSYQIKDVDKRISLLESAIRESPGAFNAYNALGYAYLEKKLFNQAIDAFKNAVQQHPEDVAGYSDLGYAYLQNNELDLAVKYFKKAVKLNPEFKAQLLADPRLRGVNIDC